MFGQVDELQINIKIVFWEQGAGKILPDLETEIKYDLQIKLSKIRDWKKIGHKLCEIRD